MEIVTSDLATHFGRSADRNAVDVLDADVAAAVVGLDVVEDVVFLDVTTGTVGFDDDLDALLAESGVVASGAAVRALVFLRHARYFVDGHLYTKSNDRQLFFRHYFIVILFFISFLCVDLYFWC